MFSVSRALGLNARSASPLPRIPELQDLYKWGWTPRRGEVIMVAGRSGSGKSAFALWLARQWGLRTLYFAGDMTVGQASKRLASMAEHRDVEAIERAMEDEDERRRVLAGLESIPIQLCPDSPITFRGIDAELQAWVEVNNDYPELIVIDNFMDIEGCESDYAAQMAAFQELVSVARNTGCTMLVLHHATDKGENTRNATDLAWPPSRREIKNGMSEKPESCLTVALDSRNNRFRVAVVKQRMGKSDPSAESSVPLLAVPEHTRFAQWIEGM